MRIMQRQRRDWDEIGNLDGLWAILSDPEKRHGAWDVDEFLQTGPREIDAVLRRAGQWRVPVGHGRALDFGCGVGRVTGALRAHFDTCLGLDISDAMVSHARRLHPDMEPAAFLTLAEAPLPRISDQAFDFIYCSLVLQHMRDRRVIEATLIDFTRLLNKGGLLVFQLPSAIPLRRRIQARPRLYGALRSAGVPHGMLYTRLGLHPIRMTGIAESEVVNLLEATGGTVLEVDRRVIAKTGIQDRTYFVTVA
jgi:SAM-dependent methyltransferase